jgi:hypothetical protein
MLAADYQEKTRMLCDLLWFDWHGCYVILHEKPLDFWPRLISHTYYY